MVKLVQNRSELEQTISETLKNQPDKPISLAIIDLDSLMPVNDAYGHEAGDEVLDNVKDILLSSLPPESTVARFGGDEFAAVLPDTYAEAALIPLEEIRQHFASQPAAQSVPIKMNLSIGIAAAPTHTADGKGLISAASEALFRAKSEGAGRAAIYVENRMVLKSNYYPRASLDRLSKLSKALNRTEASLLREALDNLFDSHRGKPLSTESLHRHHHSDQMRILTYHKGGLL